MKLKESKEVINLLCTIIESGEKTLEDGTLSPGDLIHLGPIIKDAIPALNDIGLVPKELKNISKEDLKELIVYTKEEFDLKDDCIEEFVEHILDIITKLIDCMVMFKVLKN